MLEEAKHVDFFRTWFDAVGFDPRLAPEIPTNGDGQTGYQQNDIFGGELQRVMSRLDSDRSPEAFLDAGITYNQFIEGVAAIAGYKGWNKFFEAFNVLPGLQQGLQLIQRDERRHIAYGTYLCRRIISEHPELAEFGVDRMYDLRDMYIGSFGAEMRKADGNGHRKKADEIIKLIREEQQRQLEAAEANGGGGGYGGDGQFTIFGEVMLRQVDRRIELLRNAAKLDHVSAESGAGAEEAELELEKVS